MVMMVNGMSGINHRTIGVSTDMEMLTTGLAPQRMESPNVRQRKPPANSKGLVSDPGLSPLAARRETTGRRTASWQAIVIGLVGFVIVRLLLKVLLRFGASSLLPARG